MANAGVVGMAEVVQPSSTPTGKGGLKGMPFTWSMIWVAAAVFFLLFFHVAMSGRR